MVTISVAKDFTRFPAGRLKKFSSTSGEEFRERFLLPAIKRGEPVEVNLDGTIGFGSSFLEEAFGGLVRVAGRPAGEVLRLVKVTSSDSSLVDEVTEYMREAAAGGRGGR